MKTEELKYKLGIGALTAIAYLPLWVLYLIGDIAGFFIYFVVRYRRGTVRDNLERVFGTEDRKSLRRVERRFYRHLCEIIAETVKLLHISDKEIFGRVEVTNPEVIDSEWKAGRPVVLFLGHYCNWEWVQVLPHYLSVPMPCNQIYKPLHSPVMDRIMLKIRSRFDNECIPQDKAVRRLIALKKEGNIVMTGFISDQRPSGGFQMHHWTNFLGQDTPYVVGGEKIGAHIGASFYYLDIEKPSRGHYRMTFCPVVPDPEDKGPDPYTREFMRMLEKTIRRTPEFWLWSHKRWKARR